MSTLAVLRRWGLGGFLSTSTLIRRVYHESLFWEQGQSEHPRKLRTPAGGCCLSECWGRACWVPEPSLTLEILEHLYLSWDPADRPQHSGDGLWVLYTQAVPPPVDRSLTVPLALCRGPPVPITASTTGAMYLPRGFFLSCQKQEGEFQRHPQESGAPSVPSLHFWPPDLEGLLVCSVPVSCLQVGPPSLGLTGLLRV